MICVQCDKLSASFGADTIFDQLSFFLNDGDKLGIVGVNGAGKSTLFKIITGELSPSSGTVAIARGKSIGYLAQNSGLSGENTILNEMLKSFTPLLSQEKQMEEIQSRIDTLTSEGQAALTLPLTGELAVLQEAYAAGGGLTYRSRVHAVLRQMGFSEDDEMRPISSLSGGQKTRLALTGLLLTEPDILMLDEPTNHLDTDMLQWLETYLKGYRKTVLVISHDRYFLDQFTTKILEIEHGHGTVYSGNYTAYIAQKKTNREIQARHYAAQQKEIARIEAYIEQQRRWNRERNIIAAESRQKMLDKMERVEKPKETPAAVRMAFQAGQSSGSDVLTVDNISKRFSEKILFSEVSALVKKKDRMFICGPNGCGKSTLLKILAGMLKPDTGVCEYGSRVCIGYYDQEQQQLNDDHTVLEELWSHSSRLSQKEIRSVLALFLFTGDDVDKKVGVLSGGEKARLTLAKLVLSPANLLLLDEPTNHLDIPSREALESALDAYEGTIIAVSHDRYFVRKLATRIFDLTIKPFLDYPYGYEAYLAYREKNKTAAGSSSISNHTAAESKNQYLKQKQEAAQKRKTEKLRAKTASDIVACEAEIDEIDNEMAEDAASDYMRLSELHNRKQVLEERLLQLYELEETLGAEK